MTTPADAIHDPIGAVARAVLYEGYILWPYRRSALKNQQRWTFGGVYPEAYSRSGHDDDASLMRTECLLAVPGDCTLSIAVRFLHVVERRVARVAADGATSCDDVVDVDGVRYAAWDEAVERQVALGDVSIARDAHAAWSAPIAIDAGESREPIAASDGRTAALVVRRWRSLRGTVSARVEPVAAGVLRLRVDVTNDSAWSGEPRADVLRRTFVSTHTLLHARGGAFISSIDPPPTLADASAACANIGTWPVLAGVAPAADTMLSSPIILYDYPQVAPESGGDFFDAAEIDQLLVLGVMSMTDAEQQQMAECDPRAREILERCRAMSPHDVLRLHGATRALRPVEVSP